MSTCFIRHKCNILKDINLISSWNDIASNKRTSLPLVTKASSHRRKTSICAKSNWNSRTKQSFPEIIHPISRHEMQKPISTRESLLRIHPLDIKGFMNSGNAFLQGSRGARSKLAQISVWWRRGPGNITFARKRRTKRDS